MRSRCCLCIPPPIDARQRVGISPLTDARQRLGRNVTMGTNTRATVEELLDVLYQGK
jgi:hypothetical protein